MNRFFCVHILILLGSLPTTTSGFLVDPKIITELRTMVNQLKKISQDIQTTIGPEARTTIAHATQQLNQSVTHCKDHINQFQQSIVCNIKTISIITLGFGTACYALMHIKKIVDEEPANDNKRRSFIRTLVGCGVLCAGVMTIVNADGIVHYLAWK